MTQEESLNIKMVNQYLYHDNGTGFLEWLPNTPQYIKELYVVVYGHKHYERKV